MLRLQFITEVIITSPLEGIYSRTGIILNGFLTELTGEKCRLKMLYNWRTSANFCHKYGVQSPVYFKDKSGRLVLSPKVDDSNTLHWTEGSITFTDHSITVKTHHSTSLAHPHKISLELNQCTPIKPSTGDHRKEGKTTSKEIIKVLRSEEKAKRDKNTSEMLIEEFKQQEHTLYTIINKMLDIGIRDY
ncbi:PREDICTED: uncharacterized protein LOC105314823 isoform X1 [Amphimedon queenslandica]|uniref:Uncharacterized protein n=2 Tax=Amphimedon queenslandica TaxID=400682 RepID=A0AAN0JQZ7_AMPQE|nr:PREDICTED: uncharacterized protein LOC105314823 isoform X1 [Amphimedon queenslandica]|eukprot:XP_019859455.1 PREDICTED: uncharacterized protein LOC105314823 isoform X1 [Amphimedon queenslandica]